MNVNHVNAICRATQEILTNHLGLEVSHQAPSSGIGSIPSNEIAVILGVKGELLGQIVCSFSANTAKEIVGAMMGGIQIDHLDEMCWSAVQEFGNWIAGRTATELSKESCIIDVTTPIINEGESKLHSSYPFITVPMDSRIGRIYVHISVKEEELKKEAVNV
ncbi:chemotaxis protein CheX [Halalkalibacter okhensis]|uniref:Chemotaxis protein CheC n=1 Tax=Halalkalibacter okhensis TaxID=333138 RepID=A0A0B0IE71_9BACI|nr:chemotaxis protein CheX [Halalkalibacter okhensis]KHF39187.1 chemotaxis protein CheC [Halalkalibacter okhensis]